VVVPQLRIWIVKFWCLICFGTSGVDACYLCLALRLHVDCYNMRFLYTSLPFCLLECCVWSSLLQWSSILLMWAEVRTLGSGIDNRDVAAWWIGRVLGLLWGPSLKDLLSYDSLVRTRPSLVICFSSVLCLGRVEPLLCNLGNAWRTVCLHTPNPVLWLFMYVTFYQFEVIHFLGYYKDNVSFLLYLINKYV